MAVGGQVTYSIDFVAAIARLEQGTKDGARHVKKMADEIEGATNFARNAVMALAGAVGVFSFSSAIKQAMDAGDAAAKLGDRFGIATEKMIGLQHAGQLAGASSEQIATALRGLANSGIDAARGNEAAARAFATLGLNAREFVNLPMDKQFTIVIERLGGLENASLRNATANAILGRSAGEVMGLVAEGGEAIQKATADAEAWGLAISRVETVKLEMANDAMTRVKAAAQGAFTTIALNLAPALKLLADRFADSAAEARGFKDEISSGMSKASEAVAGGIWFVERMQFAWAALKFGAAAAVNGIIWALDNLDRVFTDVMNSLAASWVGQQLGIEARQYSQTIAEVADWSIANLLRLENELEQLALSSRSLDEWREVTRAAFKTAADEMEKEAKRIADLRAKFLGGGEAGIEKPEEKPVKEDEWAKQVAQRMERLAFENSLELEQLQIELQAKSDLIDTARALAIITEEEHQKQLLAVFEKYAKAKQDLELKQTNTEKAEQQRRLAAAGTAMGNLASLMQTGSRQMFNIGKKAAIAETIIHTISAAQKAFDDGARINFWVGVAYAAAATIAGMVRVAQIRSTNFDSGGAAPVFNAVPGTSLPSEPIHVSEAGPPISTQGQAAPQPTPQDIRITLVGRQFDAGDVRDLIEQINEQQSFGATITVMHDTSWAVV